MFVIYSSYVCCLLILCLLFTHPMFVVYSSYVCCFTHPMFVVYSSYVCCLLILCLLFYSSYVCCLLIRAVYYSSLCVYSTHSWKRMCGSTIPTTDINSSNVAVVRFHSDGAQSGRGFRLTYELEGLSDFLR